MSLTIPNKIEQDLDSFFTTRTCTDIDRTKFLIKELKDFKNKLNTCLVFNCNCHSYEDPVQIECEYTGAVIHLPAFWVEVPKELAFTYIMGLLKELYEGTYTQWYIDGKIGNAGSNSGSSNTGSAGSNNCCCNQWTPVN